MKKFVLTIMLISVCGITLQAADNLRAYNLPQGGYVVLDEQNELVAMSEKGTAADMSEGLVKFLGSKPALASGTPKHFAPQEMIIADSVGPLLGDIMFDQSAPYNRHTPMYRNQHCLTGCVATAMAEILTYYKYPSKCLPGNIDYYSSKNNIHVTYTFDDVTFDWSKIRHTYIPGAGHEYTEDEAEEVAKLMAACGAAVEMDYGLDASGSISRLVPDAFVAFFDYQLGIDFEDKSDFLDDDEFHQALINEFKEGRPVYTSGAGEDGGHAYVLDGYLTYQGAEAYPLFHFNWGWNGVGNEWVRIRNSAYNQSMSIIRHIQPNNGSGVEDVTVTANCPSIFDILGNRVTTMQPGNIYIVNGKKILAH